MEVQIDISRNQYKPVAVRGTVLYFVISDMSNIDPMYQYSLVYFKKLFRTSLELTEKVADFEYRLKLLQEKIT